jgi:hypothetical protein
MGDSKIPAAAIVSEPTSPTQTSPDFCVMMPE